MSVLLICGAHDRQSSHFECQAHGIVGCVVRTFALCPLVSIIAYSSSLYIYIFRIRFGSTLYPIIIVADPPCYRLESPHGIAGMYTAWHGTAVAQAPIYGLDPSWYSDPEQTWGGTPVVVVAGDELQMPPVPFEASLLAPVEGSSHEQKAGILPMARWGEASQHAETPHGSLSGYRCSQTGAWIQTESPHARYAAEREHDGAAASESVWCYKNYHANCRLLPPLQASASVSSTIVEGDEFEVLDIFGGFSENTEKLAVVDNLKHEAVKAREEAARNDDGGCWCTHSGFFEMDITALIQEHHFRVALAMVPSGLEKREFCLNYTLGKELDFTMDSLKAWERQNKRWLDGKAFPWPAPPEAWEDWSSPPFIDSHNLSWLCTRVWGQTDVVRRCGRRHDFCHMPDRSGLRCIGPTDGSL